MACGAYCVEPDFFPCCQATLALASTPAYFHPLCFRGKRVSRWAMYHSLPSLLPSQTSQCIAGTVPPSCSHVSAYWCHHNIMLPTLRVGRRVWCAEARHMHPHQVPHGLCCSSGYVLGCVRGCEPESWIGNDFCDFELECYCEEEDSDCSGKCPVPDCSACWASCQHPCTGAGEPLQAHQIMLGVTSVLCAPWTHALPCRPSQDHQNHKPPRDHHHAGTDHYAGTSHPLLRRSSHLVSGGIVHPAGRSVTPSTPTSLRRPLNASPALSPLTARTCPRIGATAPYCRLG